MQLFLQHESIRRGKVFYAQMLAQFKEKEDEKRFITQQVIRRQS